MTDRTMSTQETITTTTTPTLQTDANYVKTPSGIIRIVEGVLCLVAFIMAAVLGEGLSWLAYIQFATVSGFLQALIYFLINLFMPNIPKYKPHGTLIELILSAVWFFFLLIAGFVAAAYAPQFKVVSDYFVGTSYYSDVYKHVYNLIIATAAFSFFSAIAYGVGCFLLFKDRRSQGGSVPAVTTTTTTSTSTPP